MTTADADTRESPAEVPPAPPGRISRRDVVKGSVATAILSLSASTVLNLRKPDPLRVMLGDDNTGAFKFLFASWSRRSGIDVVYEPAGSHAPEQREKMVKWTDVTDDRDYVADLFGLDVVHVPEFIENKHIVKMDKDLIAAANRSRGAGEPLRFDRFIGPALTTCRNPGDSSDTHYAVPLTANVGVLFRNASSTPGSDIATLRQLNTDKVLTWTAQFPERIPLELDGNGSEAMMCNLFEHASAFDDGIIEPDGRPHADHERWNRLFGGLRALAAEGRLKRALDEEGSAETFNTLGADFMRNWPSSRTSANTTPVPAEMIPFQGATIGGQNLALNKKSKRHVDALRLVNFLTGEEAQKILALHGYLPTYSPLYDPRSAVETILPHLPIIKRALSGGRHRPRIPRYSEFSAKVSDDAVKALAPERPMAITRDHVETWRSYFPTR
ncbi:extracellular solute-binding protein [Actinoplanes auranticolor]|uniref:Multiple sugar transport system substrate-binding protein n=1 Tax=Actinoplanes auranticolor TaxID=47988 RepID=A0A919S599_9ACTN|nr:extracellular solute-binding protein [Actinoplanes auranticolor]GIM63832.1 hypothetical protein Aau02nite_06630 [Actinoplanes auranticolor]